MGLMLICEICGRAVYPDGDETKEEALERHREADHADAWARWWYSVGGQLALPDRSSSRLSFYAGQAAMAESFAAGAGPVLERLEDIRAAIAQPLRERDFLIWSFDHNAWWKPQELGYTENGAEAGRYSLERALAICRRANITGIHEAIVLASVRE